MARIYMAGSYARKAELRRYRDWLVSKRYVVTSRWLDRPGKQDVDFDLLQSEPLKCAQFAHEDFEDMRASDVFMLFTGDTLSTGGRHTELGMALMLRNIEHIVVIGPRENVFQCVGYNTTMVYFTDWGEFVKDLIETEEFCDIVQNFGLYRES